jgi:hypothetical protein
MKCLPAVCCFFVIVIAGSMAAGQVSDVARLRALRDKARGGTLSSEERAELDQAMKSRGAGRATTPSGRSPADGDRRATYLERQTESLARMRSLGDEALRAAEARPFPTGPGHQFYVNNEIGDDAADGHSATQNSGGGPVRSLARGVSLLRPGDTLHLAVTAVPYRETLRLGDGFGGVPGRPIVIDGHGATIVGCDPLRLGGWEEAGVTGLYKSTKFLSELEEFTDEAKLGRVFFVFDGVVQHMGRTMKGAKARFKAPSALRPGEWTYVESEKSFYIKVSGTLADAWVEAPYRRNGVAVRAPKVALTHVAIKNLTVCRVLNDGFNLHGTTRDLLLQNIASYECGDDGISPHETCEVTIDGYWGVGNSTGMGNGYLSVTRARNVRLEGNLAHQFMSAHAPVTELRDTLIVAGPGTQPINITNSQGSRLTLDNVQIVSPAGQKILNVAGSTMTICRITALGPDWVNAGEVHATASVIGAERVTCPDGGAWEGSGNVFGAAMTPPPGEISPSLRPLSADLLKRSEPPFPGAGANPAEFKIPPKPTPHPRAGNFATLWTVNPSQEQAGK